MERKRDAGSSGRNDSVRSGQDASLPMSRLFAIGGILLALALAACGDEEDSSTETSPTQAAEPAEDSKPGGNGAKETADSGTEIMAAESEYGSILFDSRKQAIYLFDKETSPTSQCYDACAEAWPPVLTDGGPQAGAGADAKLLGTTERDDGSSQVTYAGHPLYYYAHEGPGQVLCHNVEEFGGLWLVVEPGGAAVS
jgi:predicted lipoprotein with Yx(FWY)xxD motif